MGTAAAEHSHHGPMHYVKLWAILLVLLIVSIIGPEFGIKILTLVTAFGIALVKAYMVAAHFMHLNTEKKYISYMLYTMLLLMFVFFAGVCVDVMRTQGENWENTSALKIIQEHQDAVGTGEHKKEH